MSERDGALIDDQTAPSDPHSTSVTDPRAEAVSRDRRRADYVDAYQALQVAELVRTLRSPQSLDFDERVEDA